MKKLTFLSIIFLTGVFVNFGILAQSDPGLMKTDTAVVWYSEDDLWGNGKPSEGEWEAYPWDTLKWAPWKQYDDPETALDIAFTIFARFKAAWNEDYFMIWVDVRDDILINENEDVWSDDGVELFFDIGNEKAVEYDTNDFQFIFGWNDDEGAGFAGSPEYDDVDYYFKDEDAGYVMEMAIPWENLGADGTLLEDSVIGFTIEVNDQDNQPHADWVTINHRISWAANTTGVFANPSLMGTIMLVKPGAIATPVISPEATTFSETINIEISCETPGAIIYYTTNGREPNRFSDEYSGPLELNKTTTIKAFAIDPFNNESDITEATYTLESNGINNTLRKEISIWPVPAKDVINIKLDNIYMGDYEVVILDIAGRELLRSRMLKNNQIHKLSLPLNDLQPGHYFLDIRMGDSNQTRSIILN